MPRATATARRDILEQESSPDAILGFLTIEHPNLADPIRVVSDVMAYEVDGIRYEGIPFTMRVLTDGEGPPRTQIVMQNIDRRIGEAVRKTQVRATVRLEVRSSADFDLSQDPRVPINSAAPIYTFSHFELTGVDWDAVQMTGDVERADYSVEPFPSVRATQDRTPGLFR